jgi:hypothetical protein
VINGDFMSALKIIQASTRDLIAAVTPSFLHLLPDLPFDYGDRHHVDELTPLCRSLLLARFSFLRRSFFRWSRIKSHTAAQRMRAAFSCWAFQASKPRLPFSSSLSVVCILQPSCRSSLLAAATAFFCSSRSPFAPSMGSKWIRGVILFLRHCIICHISERVMGWYTVLVARRFTAHWRVVASQLALFRTLARWRRRQKLIRHIRAWRISYSQESKIRLHRCYFDSLSYQRSLKRHLVFWHQHAVKVSAAKSRLKKTAAAIVIRRAFFAWRHLIPILSFTTRCCSNHALQLKHKFFEQMQRARLLSIHSNLLAQQMRASVHTAFNARMLRSAFSAFFCNAALSRRSIKNRERDVIFQGMCCRHGLSKMFKRWSFLAKENRLQASQQVTC